MSGAVERDGTGRLARIILNQANWWAHCFAPAFQALAGPEHLTFISGES
jgi:hypothetical protein